MFCSHCQKELPEDARFCSVCGRQLSQNAVGHADPSDLSRTSEEAYSQQASEPEHTLEIGPEEMVSQGLTEDDLPVKEGHDTPNKPKKRRFIKVLVASLLILLLLIIVPVLGYFTFFPAKWILVIAGQYTLKEKSEALNALSSRYEQQLLIPYYEETTKTGTRLDFKADADLLTGLGLDKATADFATQIINQLTLRYDNAHDAGNKTRTDVLGISYMNNPIITLDTFVKDKSFGLSLPELTDKRITGQFADFPGLNESLPGVFTEEQLTALSTYNPWLKDEIYQEMKASEFNGDKILYDYLMFAYKSISGKNMSIKNGVEVQVFEEASKYREVTLFLDRSAQAELMDKILKKMETDNQLYDFFDVYFKFLNNIVAYSGNMSFLGEDPNTPLFDLAENKEALTETIQNYRAELSEEDFPETLTLKAYIKGREIALLKLAVPLSPYGDKFELTIADKWEGGIYRNQILINTVNDGAKMDLRMNGEMNFSNAAYPESIRLNMDSLYELNGESMNMSVKFASDEKSAGGSESDHTLSLDVNISGLSASGPDTASVSLLQQGQRTRNSKGYVTTSDYDLDINVSVPNYLPNPLKLTISVESQAAYGETVTVPDTSGQTILDIATATPSDYENLVDEIQSKLGFLSLLLGGL